MHMVQARTVVAPFYIQYALVTFAVRGDTCAEVCRYCFVHIVVCGLAEGWMRRWYIFLTTPRVDALLSPSDPVASRRYGALQVFLHLHSFHVPPVLRPIDCAPFLSTSDLMEWTRRWRFSFLCGCRWLEPPMVCGCFPAVSKLLEAAESV